jgi:hypothetical protein
MTTQTTTNKKNNSGIKAGLKTMAVISGALLIPFYAIYFNTSTEDKLEMMKSSTPVVETKTIEVNFVEISEEKSQPVIEEKTQIDFNTKSFDETYKYNRDTFGEGIIFTWNGGEYVVNTYIEPIPSSKYDSLGYADAFVDARSDLGACNEFNWRGNKYNTCLAGESVESITASIEVKENELLDNPHVLANK